MIIRKKFVSEYYVSKIPNLSWDAVGDNTFSSNQLSKYCCISLADDQKKIHIWIFCKQNSPDICDFIQGLKISRVVPESTVRFAFGIRSFTIDNFTFFGANYLKYSLWKIISCGYKTDAEGSSLARSSFTYSTSSRFLIPKKRFESFRSSLLISSIFKTCRDIKLIYKKKTSYFR